MRRILLTTFLLPTLMLHAGCSVFGVATRGDLEDERRASAARQTELRTENRVLRDRIERLDSTLERVEGTLLTMESQVVALDDRAGAEFRKMWSQTGDLHMRLAAMEDEFGSVNLTADELRGDLESAGEAARTAQEQARSVRADLSLVADRAELAQSRSDTLLRAWVDQLRAERTRLERQLAELDASLARWNSEVFSEVSATAPLLEGAVRSETVPEEATDAASEAAASQSAAATRQ